MYEYEAIITSIRPNGVVYADIDVGFDIVVRNQRLSLKGVGAPELPEGATTAQLLAREQEYVLGLKEFIPEGTQVVVRTFKGQLSVTWEADVFTESGIHVNTWLVNQGYMAKDTG